MTSKSYEEHKSGGILSENMQQIDRRIPISKYNFNKVDFQLY